MTLVEFLTPLKNKARSVQCLAVLYYFAHYRSTPSMSVPDIRNAFREARVPQAASMNIADVLARSGPYSNASDVNAHGHKLWRLTDSGTKHIRQLLDLADEGPEMEHDVSALQTLARGITDPLISGYIEEAMLCLRVSAVRAAIVFAWSGAIRALQARALLKGDRSLNTALQKHDPKVKHVGKIDDFASIKDATTLLACRELAILDKGQWQTLDEALRLRNSCGHPTRYRPGVKKASSFIEDVVGIVFV
jgi:hypothetical protein